MSIRRCGSSSTAVLRRVLIPVLTLAALGSACSAAGDADIAGAGSTKRPEAEASTTTIGATGRAATTEAPPGTGAGASRAPTVAFAVAEAVWTGCEPDLQCATVAVPLDHARPDGPTIDLGLVRVPAVDADGSGVRGSVFINPGGPGGSGVAYVRGGFRLDDDTMDDYHLVGFDPRGVGTSAPLRCGPEPDDGPGVDLSPDDPTERAALDGAARALAERCQRLDGDLLPHLSTDSVVDDLDLLRQAVGDGELHYLGQSYGTLIGLRYADRYGDRVGHLVLDGVVDPTMTLPQLLAQQAGGFDRVFEAMDRACGTAFPCPDGGVIATRDRLMDRLERDGPIGDIGPAELDIATLLALYSESLWPGFAAALSEAEAGHTDGLRSLNELYARSADPAAYNGVVCSDTPVPVGPEAWDDLVEDLVARSERFGAALGNEVRACAHWPVRAAAAPDPVTADGSGPILLLSTTGDAPTPLVNAIDVAAALDGAGLVTVEDDGHTAYGRNFCVDRIVADYFATGAVPPAVHRC